MKSTQKDRFNDYLKNADLNANLREKTMFGFIAVIGSNGIRFIIQMAGIVILARILFPEDFGLMAMVVAITGFFNVFKDAGLSMATIQRKEISHEQISTLFWIILAISFLFMICICAISPAVAWFYGDDRLFLITLSLSISIFIGGFGLQHRALLRRRMNLVTVAGIDISVQLISTIIGICLALLGTKYWALVGMHASRPLIATLLLWMLCPWRPGLPKRGSGVKQMLAFGGHLSFSRIMGYLVNNLDKVLIGSIIGSYTLGLYTKAYSLMMRPIRQVNLPLSNTIIPALSRLQNDHAGYRNYFRKAIFLSTTLAMPIIIFLFIATQEIIIIILGEKWGGAVPLFKALVPAAFIYTFNGTLGWALIPLGKTKHLMKITIIEGICILSAFLIGIKWGALGVSLSISIQAVMMRPIFMWYSFKNSLIRFKDFFMAVYRPALASIITGAIILKFKINFVQANNIYSLLILAAAYFFLYFSLWVFIPGGRKEIKIILSYIDTIKEKLLTIKYVS